MSVALLLVLSVSVTPEGGATVTVLVSVPVAFGSTVPATEMLMVWPLARFSPLQTPVPASKLPVPGVQFAPISGTASVSVTLLTVLGPLLVTVIV